MHSRQTRRDFGPATRWATVSVAGLIAITLMVPLGGCTPSARKIAEDLSSSTLYVESLDGDGKPLSQGSAFFVTPDAAITNMHVLKWAKTLKVSSPDKGVSFEVLSVVGVDFDRDLCVLRLSPKEGRPLPFAKKDSVAVGDKVFVSGNPKGLAGTVSTGIVSGVRDGGTLIQIDAAISPGSSGGPVVNERGEVLGVATLSVVDGQNLNFAVGLLGGVAARTVDWPVADVGKLSLSDRDLMFLIGPVKRIQETVGYPKKGLSYLREEIIFDERGMITMDTSFLDGEPNRVSSREYFDARIPSFWDGPLTYEEGIAKRLQEIHISETINPYEGSPLWADTSPPDRSDTYDAFGRMKEYRQVSAQGSRVESCEYDNKGRLSRNTAHLVLGGKNRPPLVTEFGYVEDENGNWVRKTERTNIDERVAAWAWDYGPRQISRKIDYFTGR